MEIKPRNLTASVLLCAAFSITPAKAALLSIDWHASDDRLITRDTVTRLDWLDLTATNNMSRNYILTQLGSGGLFAGWRYASANEVVALWSDIGIDLLSKTSQLPGLDPAVLTAAGLLGNTFCEYNCTYFPYGAAGITSDRMNWPNQEVYAMVGASHVASIGSTNYYIPFNVGQATGSANLHFGHYLVQTSPSPVPVPAASWLFGSGVIGIVGLARRKKTG